MTKVSLVLSIFTFLEARMCKFLCFLYHCHYLFAISPPSIHEFLEIQEMKNRRIVTYRLPSSLNHDLTNEEFEKRKTSCFPSHGHGISLQPPSLSFLKLKKQNLEEM